MKSWCLILFQISREHGCYSAWYFPTQIDLHLLLDLLIESNRIISSNQRAWSELTANRMSHSTDALFHLASDAKFFEGGVGELATDFEVVQSWSVGFNFGHWLSAFPNWFRTAMCALYNAISQAWPDLQWSMVLFATAPTSPQGFFIGVGQSMGW